MGFPMFFPSRWMPCPYCGASVRRDEDHTCDPTRRAEFVMFQLREDITHLSDEVVTWLESNVGRFEVWLARRKVRRS